MDKVGMKEARNGLTRLFREGRRVIVGQYGRDVGGLVPASEAKLLERLERAGELERLRERYPEEV